jgi:hypothetical protein
VIGAAGRAFRRAAVPLFWYYALTIAVPVANGSAAASGFVPHAAIVVTLPLLLVAGAAIVKDQSSRFKSSRFNGSGGSWLSGSRSLNGKISYPNPNLTRPGTREL